MHWSPWGSRPGPSQVTSCLGGLPLGSGVIYLFLAALGLHCYVQAFSSCRQWVRASLHSRARVQDHGLQYLWCMCLVATACGIFLDQGLNLSPLHWQADS